MWGCPPYSNGYSDQTGRLLPGQRGRSSGEDQQTGMESVIRLKRGDSAVCLMIVNLKLAPSAWFVSKDKEELSNIIQIKNIILWIFDIINPNPICKRRDNLKMGVVYHVHSFPV